jgi:hypothetical protein
MAQSRNAIKEIHRLEDKRHMSRKPQVFPILLAMVLLSGCTTIESVKFSGEASKDAMQSSLDRRLKAPPAAGAGYVPMQELVKDYDLPFNKAWIKQDVDWNRYRTIYIAPVNTEYLMQANWWQESIRIARMRQDVQNMAAFMQAQFIMAFQYDPQHRWQVVMSPERGSLTLEMAITELVPSKVVLNAVKIAAPFPMGLAASALERGTESQCTVAFEARVKDADSGQIVAMFADREYATVRPIDLKGFTWYGNAEDIIRRWAQQFVQVANRRPGEIIEPASTFSLMPW